MWTGILAFSLYVLFSPIQVEAQAAVKQRVTLQRDKPLPDRPGRGPEVEKAVVVADLKAHLQAGHHQEQEVGQEVGQEAGEGVGHK